MDTSLQLRVTCLFVLSCTSLLGVAMPTLVHRRTTGRWPGHAPSNDDADNEEPAHEILPPKGHTTVAVVPDNEQPLTSKTAAPDEEATTTTKMNYMHVVKLLSALGCGAIVATGTCHVGPASIKHLGEALGEFYPFALMIATVAIVIMYTVEHELTLQLQMRAHRRLSSVLKEGHNHQQHPQVLAADVSTAAAAAAAGGDDDRHLARQEDAYEIDECDRAKLIRASVATHVLEIGVAVHSVIIGFAMGMITDTDMARTLTIALSFHQFSEGCAVGATILESRLGVKHTLILWFIFALTAPLGIAAGIVTEQTYGNPDSKNFILGQGILEALATGVLLYMSLVDMMPNLFKLPAADEPSTSSTSDDGDAAKKKKSSSSIDDDDDEPPSPLPAWYRALLYGSLALGTGVMLVIAKWA